MLRRSRGASLLALLLVLALFLATPGVVLAQGDDESSNHALPILRMGVGTRMLGMGGAGTAAATDATAGYWNPAGLSWSCGTQISAMHALGMEADRRMSFVAAAHRFDWGALGASFLTAGMDDIEGRDETGAFTENFSYGDLALMLHGSYASDLGDFGLMSIGGTFKYLRQSVDIDVDGDDAATGIGFDFGVGLQPLEWMRVGVTLKDFVTEVGDDEDANQVPMNLRGGIALMPYQGFTFAFDLAHTENEEDMKFHAGTEFAFPISEDFGGALRLGLNDGHMTFGLGLAVKMVEFNYAFIEEPEAFLEESHRLGVTLRFKDAECPFDLRPHEGFARPRVKTWDEEGIWERPEESTKAMEPEQEVTEEVVQVREEVVYTYEPAPRALPMAYINFASGSAEISGADPVPILEDIAEIMKKYPAMTVKVVGHTDNVGDAGFNMVLSERRAEAVKAYLVNLGVGADRLLTEGKGEQDPITTNETMEGRARNRRIEFKVLS